MRILNTKYHRLLNTESYSFLSHIYVNILHNRSSRCVLRALVNITIINWNMRFWNKFLFSLSAAFCAVRPKKKFASTKRVRFSSSRKMNERLENLTCVPPWTLSPEENWIKYFFFFSFYFPVVLSSFLIIYEMGSNVATPHAGEAAPLRLCYPNDNKHV